MSLKLIHAADLHLDSPLRGLAAYEGAPLERLRGASREAFSALIDVALEMDVNFLVLAGDIWDGDWPDVGAGLFFAAELGRLRQRGIHALMVRGNHDAQSRTRHVIELPDNVHVFGTRRAETRLFEDYQVAFHGRSFSRPDITDNIAIDYPPAEPGLFNVGLLHTALEGHANHARYAPCSLDDLRAKQYDYWALGHVHERRVLQSETAAKGGAIAYSGVLQGRHVRETGAKGAWFVELTANGANFEALDVDRVRWHQLDVDISAAASIEDTLNQCADGLAELLDETDNERLHAARIRLLGHTPLHAALCGQREQYRQELLGRTVSLGSDQVFLEKLVIDTSPPRQPDLSIAASGALADVSELLNDVSSRDDFQAEAFKDIQSLVESLPPAAREQLQNAMATEFNEFDSTAMRRWLQDAKLAVLEQLAEQ